MKDTKRQKMFLQFSKPKKREAFTLAEVLITLGIIGVVAALTIPTLIQSQQKQSTIAALKKSYTNLSQAVKQSEIDNGPNKNWDWGTSGDAATIAETFKTYWAPYLKILKYCTNIDECGYKEQLKDLKGNNTNGIVSPTTRTTVLLSDGTLLIVWNDTKWVVADINGSKPPNTNGLDVFIFEFDENKGLMPYGYFYDAETTNSSCGPSGLGAFCAAKIVKDGWQIKSDYPWK